MRSANGKRVISVKASAEMLGISKNAAYDGVRSGDIPSFRIGGKWLVSFDALEILIANGRNVA